MENIIEKLEELKESLSFTYCEDITSFNDGYICDVITEIADNHVNIYNNDLLEWAKGNYSYIGDATREFGRPDDFIKEIKQGQFYAYEQDLYENIEDMILLYAYNYLKENEISLNDEQIKELEDSLSNIDNNNEISDIISYIDEILESKEV